jgi:Neuraminidase (sialidase)
VAVSTNGGSSFGPSTQVSNHGDSNAIRASLAVDEAGVLYAAWTRIDGAGGWNEVFFSKSSDGGSSWSTPTVVLNSGFFGADTHIAAGASGKVWIAAATDDSFRKNLRMLRSEDGGLSWSQSMVTNYTVGGSFADHPSLALDEAGTLYAIWQNRAGSGQPMRVFVARSTDGGETWTGYTQVSDDVVLDEGQYDTYAPPSLQAGRGGRLYAVWADGREGSNASPDSRNYDVYLSHSDDGGATWNADMRINDRPEVLGQYRASLAIKPGDLQDEVLVAWEDMRATGTDGTRYSQLHYRKLTPP